MKRLLTVLLALTVLSTAAAAAETAKPVSEPVSAEASEPAPAFVRVWGKVSPWEGEGIYLKNSNPEDHLNEVVVHVGEAPAVDAATGLPMDLKEVKEGSTLYAWVKPYMTMSLPPQTSAEVVVGNLPADAAAPEYCEIAGPAVPGADSTKFALTGGETLTVNDKTAYTPWLTRQIVRMENLIPGARVLVWKDKAGTAEKVLLFPYSYEGYVSLAEDGTILFDGEALAAKARPDGLVPIRAVAEAAGYAVRWADGVVITRDGEAVFTAQPGSDVLQMPDGEMGLSAPCLKEGGVTYLAAKDLCRNLNLFLS